MKHEMLKIVRLSFVAVAALLPLVAQAAPGDLRVGYVDMQKAITGSRAGQDAQKRYESQLKKSQGGIDSKKGDFERQRENFAKQKESLNPKALADKQEQLINLEKDLKRSFEDTQDQLRRENARLVGELVKKIRRVVDEVGKEEKFTLILEKSSQTVLFADSSIDITEKVIKRFDALKE